MRQMKKHFLPTETKILGSDQEIFTQITNLIEKSERGVSICTPIGGLQLLDKVKPLLESYKSLIKKHREGRVNGGIRWLTHIENTTVQTILIKKFLDIGINIRHVNNLPPLSFGVSEKQFQMYSGKDDRRKDDPKCSSVQSLCIFNIINPFLRIFGIQQ